LAFSNTKTALAHAISYPLTLRHGVPHGIACSFTLPLVWSMAQGISPERDAVLAEVFGSQETNPTGALRSFLEIVGVDCSFTAYGVSPAETAEILRTAAAGARGQNFINTQL
jgi:alcohol dehydrogenase class IV